MEYQNPIRELLFIDSDRPEFRFALQSRFSPMSMQIELEGPMTRIPVVLAHYMLIGMFGGKGIYAFNGVTVEA